jgi:hypothetical protein
MPRFQRATIVSVVLAALAGPSPVRADLALSLTGVTGGFVDGVPRVIGWEFTTGSQALSVSQLGVFDFSQDGLLTTHDVAIYNASTHASVVSATVPAGISAPLSGFFREANVAPTVLAPDTGYVIAASWVQNADPFVWSPGIPSPSAAAVNLSVSPSVTLGLTGTGLPASARYEDTTSSLQFPTKRIADFFPGDPRAVFIGPNFTFSPVAVPEPSSLTLACAGALIGTGWGWYRRRRHA